MAPARTRDGLGLPTAPVLSEEGTVVLAGMTATHVTRWVQANIHAGARARVRAACHRITEASAYTPLPDLIGVMRDELVDAVADVKRAIAS